MALPTTIYVEKENGSQTLISNAVQWTRKRVLWSEGAYRDSFGASFMGGAIPNANDIAGPSLAGALIGQGGVSGSGPATTTYLTEVPATISSPAQDVQVISLSDEIGHYPWRVKEYIRWQLQFWDAATVGLAIPSLSVATTSGSATLTTSDTTLLTPGQAISGTGIPTGAIVLAHLDISDGLPNRTQIIISSQATASATVIATLTGSNCLGSFFEDEIIGWGSAISFPT